MLKLNSSQLSLILSYLPDTLTLYRQLKDERTTQLEQERIEAIKEQEQPNDVD